MIHIFIVTLFFLGCGGPKLAEKSTPHELSAVKGEAGLGQPLLVDSLDLKLNTEFSKNSTLKKVYTADSTPILTLEQSQEIQVEYSKMVLDKDFSLGQTCETAAYTYKVPVFSDIANIKESGSICLRIKKGNQIEYYKTPGFSPLGLDVTKKVLGELKNKNNHSSLEIECLEIGHSIVISSEWLLTDIVTVCEAVEKISIELVWKEITKDRKVVVEIVTKDNQGYQTNPELAEFNLQVNPLRVEIERKMEDVQVEFLPYEFAVRFSESIDPSTLQVEDFNISGTAIEPQWELESRNGQKSFTLRLLSVKEKGSILVSLPEGKVNAWSGWSNLKSISQVGNGIEVVNNIENQYIALSSIKVVEGRMQYDLFLHSEQTQKVLLSKTDDCSGGEVWQPFQKIFPVIFDKQESKNISVKFESNGEISQCLSIPLPQ